MVEIVMRPLLATLTALGVMALAYWAYMENFRTQQALRALDRLNTEIATHGEHLTMLRAEWAYLNRPDRLRDLVELNFEQLGLMPLAPEHFGEIEQVAFPPLPGLGQAFGTLTATIPGREDE
jgi:hypothetical protein